MLVQTIKANAKQKNTLTVMDLLKSIDKYVDKRKDHFRIKLLTNYPDDTLILDDVKQVFEQFETTDGSKVNITLEDLYQPGYGCYFKRIIIRTKLRPSKQILIRK